MEVKFTEFWFYHIDVDYLKYLYEIDNQVQYSEEKDYSTKPFVGIMVMIGNYDYFIPLSSPKEKYKTYRNTGRDYFIIHQEVEKEEITPNDITVTYPNGTIIKHLAFLNLRKMIPVPKTKYTKINFNQEEKRYATLLIKEFLLCQSIQDDIRDKAAKIYEAQKRTGKIHPFYCNFTKLEEACDNYRIEKV